MGPAFSPDASTVYFDTGGNSNIWQVKFIPIVDFNSDGIVDAADMCIMVDNWHTDNTLCDIAPLPLGDGIVDVEDLRVLAEHLFEDYRLIAHWELDETEGSIASDSVAYCDGVLFGDPVWQPNSGVVAGALQFDGIDDYVATPFLLDPRKEAFSVFTWIKGGGPRQAIISQVGGTDWLSVDPSDGKLITKLMHPPFPQLVSESVVTDGQWHHVGLVYDRAEVRRHLYVDGIEVAADTTPVGGVPSGGGLHIGAGQSLDAASFFSGLIDDVRLYNAALGAEEIETLAQ